MAPLPRLLPLGAAALWALAVLPSSAPAQRDADDEPEVRNLVLQGVKSVDKEDLEKSIATSESHCRSFLVKPFCLFTKSSYFYEREYLDRRELRRDVIRIKVFYWRRGYRETRVDTLIRPKGEGVEVRFRISEGPPTIVTRTAVEYPAGLLDERTVRRHFLLRKGRPLDLLRLDTSIVKLKTVLWNKGYADADVVADSIGVDPATRTASVRLRIDPKWRTTVGEIRVTGNRDVSARTIRSSLFFDRGDAFRREDLIRSQRQLYRTNMFRRAAIFSSPDDDSVKIIEVKVQEAPLHDVRTRVGFNTVEFIQTDLRYIEYDWFGRGRQLTLQGALGNLGASQLNGTFPFRDVLRGFEGDGDAFLRPTWHVSADILQPAFFFSPKNSGGVGVFAHRRSAPGIYVDRGYGASASFTRDLAVRAPASLSYRFEVTRVEAGDVYFCVNYGVCEDRTIRALRDRQRMSPVAVTTTIDRTSDPLAPRHGYQARFDVEHASAFTMSDFRYNRAAGEGAVYRPIGRRAVLAGHLKLGAVRALASTERAVGVTGGDEILHPRKRFYAGGARSVRGFGENQLGPRVLTISDETLRGRFVNDTTGAIGYSRCDPSIPIEQCDPNADGLFDRYFLPRPVGGNSLIEGSVELRAPLFWKLTGALFVDGAIVGQGSFADFASGMGAVTPGAGVRYRSPVGPIRIDLGYNPRLREDLTVFTEDRSTGTRRLVRLNTARDQHPREKLGGFKGLLSRLTLHLSIGEAY